MMVTIKRVIYVTRMICPYCGEEFAETNHIPDGFNHCHHCPECGEAVEL